VWFKEDAAAQDSKHKNQNYQIISLSTITWKNDAHYCKQIQRSWGKAPKASHVTLLKSHWRYSNDFTYFSHSISGCLHTVPLKSNLGFRRDFSWGSLMSFLIPMRTSWITLHGPHLLLISVHPAHPTWPLAKNSPKFKRFLIDVCFPFTLSNI
jgi:hypothetical protein